MMKAMKKNVLATALRTCCAERTRAMQPAACVHPVLVPIFYRTFVPGMAWAQVWIRRAVIGMAAAAVMLQIGCGSSGTYDNTTAAAGAPAMEMASEDVYLAEYDYAAEEGAGAMDGGETVSVASNRKLIKDVYMDVETGDFDKLLGTVEGRVDSLGGYIENMSVHNGSGSYGNSLKGANLKIRIPKDNLNQFVTEVSEYSNVVSRSEDTQDVTMQYVDLESHKKALVTEQERLLELLERAETMEDIIAIEERLSQIRYEIESMESQLRTYDNLVDFSTVTLNIREVEVLTPTREETAWEKMSKGFVASMNSLGKGLKNTFIWFVINLPYLIFWAVIIVIIVCLVRVARKRRKRKLEKFGWKQDWQGKTDRKGKQGQQVNQELQPGVYFDMSGRWSGRQGAGSEAGGSQQSGNAEAEAGGSQQSGNAETEAGGSQQSGNAEAEAGSQQSGNAERGEQIEQ